MSTETQKSASNEAGSISLLEQASIDLWEICTQTNIDTFNGDITQVGVEKRVKKFGKRLDKFQRESFPTNKL